MKISRDKEFQRRRTDTAARPKQDADTDLRADSRRGGSDFDFRQARDAPVSADELRRRRQERSFEDDLPQYDTAETDSTDTTQGSADQGHTEPPRESSGSGTRRHTLRQHGNQYQQRFQEAAQAEEPKAEKTAVQTEEPPKPSKLTFTADELPPEAVDKKLTQARRKAERTEVKLDQAEKRLPSYRKLRMETTSDPDTGKAKKHLKFEKEAKPQGAHVRGSLPMRPVKAGANMAGGYLHQRVYQSEEENVGVKAAHRMEMAAEGGARSAYYFHKTAPYRRVTRLQNQATRAQANVAYRQMLQDNPELKKNMLARMWQKQKLKRQYAKAAREAQRTGKRMKPLLSSACHTDLTYDAIFRQRQR